MQTLSTSVAGWDGMDRKPGLCGPRRIAAPARFCAEVGRIVVRSLYQELVLYPKPGLVSLIDNGSHADMNAVTFMRSLFSLRRYFIAMTAAGMRLAPFEDLKELGVEAEQRMMRATGGVNTHRGAIFCLGLLCATVGASHEQGNALSPAAIRANLLIHWGAALERHSRVTDPVSHGLKVAEEFKVGGAREEAALGFPSVFEIALPRLQKSRHTRASWNDTKIDALFLLMSHIHDTNVYSRGGAGGAKFVKESAHRFIDAGGTLASDWEGRAVEIHHEFIERGLSPGGAADLLAASCFVYQVCAVFDALDA